MKRRDILSRREISCTPEGEQWLAMALDPFHDYTMDLLGLPDLDPGPSFVSMKTQSLTITAPAGGVSNWSLNIGFLPTNKNSLAEQFLNAGGIFPVGADQVVGVPQYIATNPLTLYGMGPITATASSDGSSLGPNPANPLGGVGNSFSSTVLYTFGDSSITSPCRVIGMAFEVVDVTPTLYQQGTVTAYRVPYSKSLANSAIGPQGGPQNEVVAYHYTGFPTSQADATALSGSRTWDAREGIYMVGNMADFQSCKAGDINGGQKCIISDTPSLASSIGNPLSIWVQTRPGGDNGFALSGCCFSGLNLQFGALRLTTRIVYEYFPKANLQQAGSDPFVSLSSPSAPFDAKAFESYARAISILPVAVPVGMNAMGDWFKMVVKAVHQSGLVNMIHPLMGVGVGLLNSYINPSNQQLSVMRPNQQMRRLPAPKRRVRRQVKKQKNKRNAT